MARKRRVEKKEEKEPAAGQASASYSSPTGNESTGAYALKRLLRIITVQVFLVVGSLLGQKYFEWSGAHGGAEKTKLARADKFYVPCGLPLPVGSNEGDLTKTFSLFSERVVTPKGVVPATVVVRNGFIASVEEGDRRDDDEEGTTMVTVDYGDLVISPGLVDLHVHVNEPGRETWEGFSSATRAAAAGGVTSFLDMPLNSAPAAVTGKILKEKMKVAKDKLMVDVGFWGGLVPENAGTGDHGSAKELYEMLEVGAVGFKAFMSPSGIEDFGNVNETHIEAGLKVLSQFSKPLMLHAEIPFDVAQEEGADASKYETYMSTRPGKFEVDAIRLLFKISKNLAAERVPHKIHVAHVSESSILDEIQLFKNKNLLKTIEGTSFTVETCPHYLFFEAEKVPDGATQYKCAPPIRAGKNRERLWDYMKKGVINTVGSDHSPSPPELKYLETGDFLKAWGGIAGIQYSLPATWTAARKAGATIEDMAEWWSAAPAAVAGLSDRGAIEKGKKADFVVWDDRAEAETEQEKLHHKHKLSPYNELKMKGKVEATYVSGHLVFSEGEVATEPCGAVIRN
jgi:allantoinase